MYIDKTSLRYSHVVVILFTFLDFHTEGNFQHYKNLAVTANKIVVY